MKSLRNLVNFIIWSIWSFDLFYHWIILLIWSIWSIWSFDKYSSGLFLPLPEMIKKLNYFNVLLWYFIMGVTTYWNKSCDHVVTHAKLNKNKHNWSTLNSNQLNKQIFLYSISFKRVENKLTMHRIGFFMYDNWHYILKTNLSKQNTFLRKLLICYNISSGFLYMYERLRIKQSFCHKSCLTSL